MELVYLPLTLYVFSIGFLRTGKVFYFAAANPKLPLGGFASESKFFIMENIPSEFKPKTILVSETDTDVELTNKIQMGEFCFPLFAKPNLAEAGFLASKIDSLKELMQYHARHKMDYLVQEFIDHPIELSVLIHNAEGSLTISSITERQHLSLTGDGQSSIGKLLFEHNRAKFRLNNVLKQCESILHVVLEKDQVYKLAIGNWDFGAKYVERTEVVNSTLLSAFENINAQVNLFHYARYDIMCRSMEEFLQGKMQILEINGVKGEPIHMYDEKYTLLQAYKEIFKHWEYILKISKRNIRQGASCPGLNGGFRLLYNHYKTKKTSLTKRGE